MNCFCIKLPENRENSKSPPGLYTDGVFCTINA